MNKVKKAITVITAVFTIILASLIPSASSAAPDITKYAWPPSYNVGNYGQQALLGYLFTLVDDFTQGNSGESFSFIRTTSTQRWCKDFKDSDCIKELESTGNYWTNQVLPPCENDGDSINCIEAVNLINSDGSKEELVMEKMIPGNTWPAETSPKVEAGSSSSRWVRASDKNSDKGFKVTVSGGLQLTMSSRTSVSSARLNSFQASVEPYEKINGNYTPPRVYEPSGGIRGFGGNTPNYCIWVDANECGVLTEFPESTKVELVLHLPTEISGWLLGRIDKPSFGTQRIGVSKITGQGLSRVTLSAYPVKVPLFSTTVDLAKAPSELSSYYQENKFCKDRLPQCTGYFGGNVAGSNFDGTNKLFQLFEKSFNETANVVVPRWSVRSLSRLDSTYDRCKSISPTQINGIVSTNSSIYQGSPPAFENESFTYKVAGLHYLPNKEVFQGSYDLVLKSEFARCLYGFSKAPISASVEVTNIDGVKSVVTNSFVEKNGWISLSINGFTFSQPTIKLKLTQEKVVAVPSPTPFPAPTVMPSPTPSPVLVRKSTITCVKGKTTKKVTATIPKCPAGYKKK
jgi:hypothetical protein